MKIYIFSVLVLLNFSTNAISQANNTFNWSPFQESQYNLSFDLPSPNVDIKDTLGTKMYSFGLDSTLATQVHIVDNMQIGSSDAVVQDVLNQYGADTLRAIAEVMMLVTNSQLLSVQNVTAASGDVGLEIGFEYQSLMSNATTVTFMQFYLIDNHFISFTVTGRTSAINQINTTRNTFFSSISI